MSSAPATAPRPTGLKEARAALGDLFRPRPAIYWPDFLSSASLGWGGFLGLVFLEGTLVRGVAGLVANLALYRAVLFIHELTHLKAGALPGFTAAWNLLIGVPMLVPSFTYVGVHTDHHRRTVYGTPEDPEYLPLGLQGRGRIVLFLVETAVVPALLFLRFVLLSPLGWVLPPLRRLLERHASSLVINPAYRRSVPTPAERRLMRGLEVAMVTLWGGAIVLAVQGTLPPRLFVAWYAVSFGVSLVNQVRTLGAHRYRNSGERLDVVGQLLDSVNVCTGPLGALWAPVGLRWHAFTTICPICPTTASARPTKSSATCCPSPRPITGSTSPAWPRSSLPCGAARPRDLPKTSRTPERRFPPRDPGVGPCPLIYFHRFLIITAILFAFFFAWKIFTYWQRSGETLQLAVSGLCVLGGIGLALYLRTVQAPQPPAADAD